MRLNTSTFLSIALMLAGACVLWQAESFLGDYQIYIAKLIFINAILALSLNLIYGFTGLFSLGHAGFIAIGAYVSALCILSPEQKEMMWILEPIIWPFSELMTPFWVSVLAGGLVAAIFAFIIAVPVLRLGDDYLGIATLALPRLSACLSLTPRASPTALWASRAYRPCLAAFLLCLDALYAHCAGAARLQQLRQRDALHPG